MSAASEPIQIELQDPGAGPIDDGVALCLSGGGYRAMLFHVGVLIRLNEIGLLGKLKRVSSVSGGSITAGVLGMNWNAMAFAAGQTPKLEELLVEPIREMARRTIDADSIGLGMLSPFSTVSEKVATQYRKHLFGDKTLQDLPDDSAGEGPRFVINATSVQSGALWRFSRPYMGDYRVGLFANPRTALATAVGASSAFPPVLSPATLSLAGENHIPGSARDLTEPVYRTKAVLSDGGVYDNLGLETAWKRYRSLLVSDAGGKVQAEPAPHDDWARHSLRVNELIDNQVRSLRKRQLIEALLSKVDHDGAYWGIRSHLADFPKPGILPCPLERTLDLASTPTRLKEMPDELQERLINWGYAICAAAIESWVQPSDVPAKFPYPLAGV